MSDPKRTLDTGQHLVRMKTHIRNKKEGSKAYGKKADVVAHAYKASTRGQRQSLGPAWST